MAVRAFTHSSTADAVGRLRRPSKWNTRQPSPHSPELTVLHIASVAVNARRFAYLSCSLCHRSAARPSFRISHRPLSQQVRHHHRSPLNCACHAVLQLHRHINPMCSRPEARHSRARIRSSVCRRHRRHRPSLPAAKSANRSVIPHIMRASRRLIHPPPLLPAARKAYAAVKNACVHLDGYSSHVSTCNLGRDQCTPTDLSRAPSCRRTPRPSNTSSTRGTTRADPSTGDAAAHLCCPPDQIVGLLPPYTAYSRYKRVVTSARAATTSPPSARRAPLPRRPMLASRLARVMPVHTASATVKARHLAPPSRPPPCHSAFRASRCMSLKPPRLQTRPRCPPASGLAVREAIAAASKEERNSGTRVWRGRTAQKPKHGLCTGQ